MREKPSVLNTVLDAEDVRAPAEFYRRQQRQVVAAR